MKKAIAYSGLVLAILLVTTAVLTYLAPYLGWGFGTTGAGMASLDFGRTGFRLAFPAGVVSFFNSTTGFVIGIMLPTAFVFTAYILSIVRIIKTRQKPVEREPEEA